MKSPILIIIFTLVALSTTSCDRKYYSISKEQLERMENRIIKMQKLINDAKSDLSPYNDTYGALEEIEDDADKLLNYVYQVYDDDANN